MDGGGDVYQELGICGPPDVAMLGGADGSWSLTSGGRQVALP